MFGFSFLSRFIYYFFHAKFFLYCHFAWHRCLCTSPLRIHVNIVCWNTFIVLCFRIYFGFSCLGFAFGMYSNSTFGKILCWIWLFVIRSDKEHSMNEFRWDHLKFLPSKCIFCDIKVYVWHESALLLQYTKCVCVCTWTKFIFAIPYCSRMLNEIETNDQLFVRWRNWTNNRLNENARDKIKQNKTKEKKKMKSTWKMKIIAIKK